MVVPTEIITQRQRGRDGGLQVPEKLKGDGSAAGTEEFGVLRQGHQASGENWLGYGVQGAMTVRQGL